jgi:hypothetical protein
LSRPGSHSLPDGFFVLKNVFFVFISRSFWNKRRLFGNEKTKNAISFLAALTAQVVDCQG